MSPVVISILRTTLLIASAALVYLWSSVPAQSAKASTPPPQGPTSSQLSVLGVTLEDSTLDDVRAKLGKSESRKCSREEEASDEICYVGLDGTKAVFEAGVSGGWTTLDAYKIISVRLNSQCYRRCRATSVVSKNLRTDGGLHLGLTRQEVLKLLGKPIRVTRNKLTFQWQARRPMTTEEIEKAGVTLPANDAYWDVVDTIDVGLSKGKVVEVAVHHTVTD